MKTNPTIATIFIALCAISTGATGQNVYRCGNAYSQKPCTDGLVVNVKDARSSEQKADSDALTRRDSATANALEKARLKEEAQQRAENARLAAAAAKKAPAKPMGKASEPVDGAASVHKAKPGKKSAKKKSEPQYFTARSAPERPRQPANASK